MKSIKSSRLLMIAFACLTMHWTCEKVLATNLYVSVAGTNNSPSFTNWALSCSNIQWVVNAAAANDTVWVSNGTYYLTNQISITKGITVRGFTNNGTVIVDGQTNTRCFYVDKTNAVVDSISIVNGWTIGYGGGVFLTAGTVQNCVIASNISTNGGGIYVPGHYTGGISNYPCVIRNCTIRDNIVTNSISPWARGGGGIYVDAYKWNLTVENCLIQNNQTTNYGGGININGSRGTIRNCTIVSNTAGLAGGIYFSSEMYPANPAVIDNCIIANNTAGTIVGGIYHYERLDLVITNCRINDNSAGFIGGVFLAAGGQLVNSFVCNNRATNNSGSGIYGSGSLIKNCIITNNGCDSAGNGAGIYNIGTGNCVNCLIAYNRTMHRGGGFYQAGSGAVINCTIVSNRADNSGGGYYGPDNATNVVKNTVIYLNTSPLGSNYYNIATTYFTNCCLTPTNGLLGINNIQDDPVFVNKDTGDWHLSQGSPCINAGLNEAWMTDAADIDGHRRLDRYSRQVDMGCFEYLPAGSMYLVGF